MQINPTNLLKTLATGTIATLFLVLAPGCMDITGRGPAPLARTLDPQADLAHPRIGEVYCMRGWLGIFSTGMDALAAKVDKEVPSVSVADEEWRRLKGFIINENKAGRLNKPLILVGHSWGADDSIRIAEALKTEGITVDLLITIDPVTPPDVPDNVLRVYNIYKSHPGTDALPFWRGVPIDPKTTKCPLTNIDLRTAKVGFETESIDHINIEKSDGVHEMVMEQVRQVCEMRDSQTATAPATAPATEPASQVRAAATPPVPNLSASAHTP